MLPNGTHQSMVCQKAQCRQGSLQSEQEQSKQCPCSPRQHPIADVELSKCCLRHWSSRNHCAQVWEVLPPNSTCECSLSCPIESEDQMTRHQMQKEHALVQASSQHSLEWRAHLDSQRSACLASQHQDSAQGRNAAPLHQENQDQQPSRDHQDSRHDPQQHAQPPSPSCATPPYPKPHPTPHHQKDLSWWQCPAKHHVQSLPLACWKTEQAHSPCGKGICPT
mmetsp:Transcript_29168/g.61674  ORF Transcript_29168/g.61674 Transcript_29168/m.61674 type:complete len:222 (-) Transcript_29168:198-863(-)